MGECLLCEMQVLKTIRDLEKAGWTGPEYHSLRHNCCHFCDALCRRLGVGRIPERIKDLAGRGDAVWESLTRWSEAGRQCTLKVVCQGTNASSMPLCCFERDPLNSATSEKDGVPPSRVKMQAYYRQNAADTDVETARSHAMAARASLMRAAHPHPVAQTHDEHLIVTGSVLPRSRTSPSDFSVSDDCSVGCDSSENDARIMVGGTYVSSPRR